MNNSEFEQTIVRTSATLCITGDKQEINFVLNALANAGIFYQSNRKLYPCRENTKRYYISIIEIALALMSDPEGKAN